MRKTYIFIALVVLIGVAAVGWLSVGSRDVQPIACTMEAKLCPDGSAVGRTGPNCEFAACPEAKPVPKPIGGDVVLSVGQTGKVGDLGITVNTLVGDSRCPVDVQCIWAGEFKVNVTLVTASKSETRDISSGEAPYSFDGHTISIANVIPAPKSTAKIATNEYRITFHVAVDSKKNSTSIGTVTGTVTLSPTCPVERMPPEPQCAPKPYQTTIEIFTTDGTELVKTVQTAADGRFSVTLPLGEYSFQAGKGKVMPSCSPVEVRVETVSSTIDIFCDSGIR